MILPGLPGLHESQADKIMLAFVEIVKNMLTSKYYYKATAVVKMIKCSEKV
jgi:hypothetical protein